MNESLVSSRRESHKQDWIKNLHRPSLRRYLNHIIGSFAHCSKTFLINYLLLQQINEKPSVINEYESGKAIPNPQVLSKMSRALGVQLSAKIGKKKTQE